MTFFPTIFHADIFTNSCVNCYLGIAHLQTMESGSIAKWNVQAGDIVKAGDVYCSVETDKAVMDFEAQDEAVVAKLLVAAGSDVAVGTPVMILVSEVADVAAFASYSVDVVEAAPAAVAPPPIPAPPAAAPAVAVAPPAAAPAVNAAAPVNNSGGTKIFASPLARKLASDLGYSMGSISGSGPSGRVLAADVREYQPAIVAAPATIPPPAPSSIQTLAPLALPVSGAGYTDFTVAATASDVAARLAQSKRNVPHYYLTVDICADALLSLRRTLNAALHATNSNAGGAPQTIGVYELLIKAAALSMKTVPSANAAWMDSIVRVYDSVDINIVTGSGASLATPLLRDCVGKGLRAMATELHDSDEASDNTVGTFTMLNVGMYGVKSCAPVIREPQAGALAIGALQNRIVPAAGDQGSSDSGAAAPLYMESVIFTATVSFDHRVVDGAVGAQWLAAFKSHVENPSTLLL